MNVQEKSTEEIVIVGSRYGELADVLRPLYRQMAPMAQEDIKKMLGGDVVYFSPTFNQFDDEAVGVYTPSQRLLGYVWMYQSHGLRRQMACSGRRYIKARVNRVNTAFGLMMAEPQEGCRLETDIRSRDYDLTWAADLPEVLTSVTEQSLALGIALLGDELREAVMWSDSLRQRIDNVLRDLPMDLSAANCEGCMALYQLMRQSPIAEVRHQGELLLQTLVSRASEQQMEWWVEQWLPRFFQEAAEGDLLGIYESAGYTLDGVEALLKMAPESLFHLYKVNRQRFAYSLYYAALPQPLYNRLLTLLAVREAMLEKEVENCELTTLELTAKQEELLEQVCELVERGEWRRPASAENICQMMYSVLGADGHNLTADERVMAETLWRLLEKRKGGHALRVTWQNLIGYFDEQGYFRESLGSPALCKMFFGTDDGYSNIDKGRPGRSGMLKDFKAVLPLLEKSLPQE